MSCQRCHWPEPERFDHYEGAVYRCPQCRFQWGDGLQMLVAKIDAIEASQAKMKARIERAEQTIVDLSEALKQAVSWVVPRANDFTGTLRQNLDAIRQDLAEDDEERKDGAA